MKMKLCAFKKTLISTSLLKAAIPVLLILTFQSICLGQVYSYTDVSVGEYDVMGYSAVTGYYNSSTHVYTTSSAMYSPTGRSSSTSNSGTSATVYLSINDEVGTFSVSTTFYGDCPNPYGGGGNHAIGGTGGSAQTCTDTCTPCRTSRHNQTILCYTASGTCEALALAKLNSDLTACDNNNFCNPNSPQYNQQQCDNCKSTAQENFAIATGVCATTLVGCLATRPNCADGTKQKKDCSYTCTND